MATPFRLKRSTVAGKRPAPSDLQSGELALNVYDGYLYAERNTGGVGIGTTITLLTPWQEKFGGGEIQYSGIVSATTFVGQVSSGVITATTLNSTNSNITSANIVSGIITTISGSNLNYTGVGTITTLSATTGSITNLNGTSAAYTNANIVTGVVTTISGTNLNYSGVGTISRLVATATSFSQLQVTGISTFTNGPVFVGSGTSTGTTSQRLQVTGGAYVSGAVGVATTNPRETLDVVGTIGVQASGSANRFYIQHNDTLNSLDFVFV